MTMTKTSKLDTASIPATTGKRAPGIVIDYNAACDTVTVNHPDGQNVALAVDELTEVLVRQATCHGLKQKLGDAMAIPRDPDTGLPATVDDKWSAVMRVLDGLRAGEWNQRAAGEGEGGGLLLRAMRRLSPEADVATLRGRIAGLDKKQQAALRANPRVAAAIAEIKREDAARAGAGVDGDSLLDSLLD